LSSFPFVWVAAAEGKKQKVLYFTRSIDYEHSVVAPGPDGQSHSGRILTELSKAAGIEVVCSKDGSLFDGDLDAFDALVFYDCGDMTLPSVRKTPPMTAKGKQRLVDTVAAGKPFVGIHSSCYWGAVTDPNDAYLAMVGGEFIAHGAQQTATMKVVSPNFPGAKDLGASFALHDEWYAMKDYADDLHVVLVQETAGMTGDMYQRPPFPATWARKHGKGRVFFTSMGHPEAVWTNKNFQNVLMGGLAWALGNVEADITPNIAKVTPKANQVTN
jgi:hypothetical protein